MVTPLFSGVLASELGLRLLRLGGGGLLSFLVLNWVVHHVGPFRGEVVVHVTEPDVRIDIGGNVYEINGFRSRPIVCELPPGHHRLRMSRGEQLLFDEEFWLERNRSVVLTAWDRARWEERRDALPPYRGASAPAESKGASGMAP